MATADAPFDDQVLKATFELVHNLDEKGGFQKVLMAGTICFPVGFDVLFWNELP